MTAKGGPIDARLDAMPGREQPDKIPAPEPIVVMIGQLSQNGSFTCSLRIATDRDRRLPYIFRAHPSVRSKLVGQPLGFNV